jgi:CBS domain-containing protein
MLTVREAMTPNVITVPPDKPLKDVARILIDAGITGLPVVDAAGTVVGVISEADFVVKGQGAGAVRHRRLARLLGESETTRHQLAKLGARTAGEAMTSPAVTITPARTMAAAAAVMVERRVNRLPVVDDGRLVGIITRADLVRAYLRSDEELAETIREDVLRRTLWLDPAGFRITVRNGEATVSGQVDRRSSVDILEEAVETIPGIVSVTTDLRWALDDRHLEPATPDPFFPHGLR